MHQTLTAAAASVSSPGNRLRVTAAAVTLRRRAIHYLPHASIHYLESAMTIAQPSEDQSTPPYFSESWGGHLWTEWISLENKNREILQITTKPGLYRVRITGEQRLAYIGQTGRSLRQRIRKLRIFYDSPDEMPWNGRHTAAPSLWAWRDAEGYDFEVSVAPLPDYGGKEGKRHRLAQEAYLLWKYRCEHGDSTLCNYGRFHPDYFRSTRRSKGKRGGKLPEGEINPAGGPSSKPLHNTDSPQENNWMRLPWEQPLQLHEASLERLPEDPAIYMMNQGEKLLYIGETKRLRSRLNSHKKGKFHDKDVKVSYALCPKMHERYQRLEWENDCIGACVGRTKEPPELQFMVQDW